MEQAGYKHFSHEHNLILHEMPEGVDVSCSGCNSSAIGTVYVCWQCNFFLHEQCYRAARSLKHPSHPHHPLTLVPYPTYLSNSFYCNSCEVIGTGISYSCADCEFDLHVQCAYSISRATSFHKTNQFQELVPSAWTGRQNSNMAHNIPFDSVPVPDSLPVPFSGAQNSYMHHNSVSSDQYHSTHYDLSYSLPSGHQNSVTTSQVPSMAQISIPTSNQDPVAPVHDPSMAHQTGSHNPIPNVQYPSMPQNEPSVSIPASSYNPNANVQYHSIAQTESSVSIPSNYSPKPITSGEDSSMPQNRPSISIAMNSQNPNATIQYPSIAQTEPCVSIPNSYPSNPIPRQQNPSIPNNGTSVSVPSSSHNPLPNVEYPSMTQTEPSVSIPTTPPNPIPNNQDPLKPQNEPSVSIPTSSQSPVDRPQFMTQTGPPVSIPTNSPNPIPCPQDPPIPQKEPPVTIPPNSPNATQYPAMSQTEPSFSVPTNPPNEISTFQDSSMPQNKMKNKEIKHFSHSHNLYVENFQEDGEYEATCSACEDTLVGKGYPCVETECDFLLHESCFHLKQEIQHKSHPEHPLTLLPLAPYNNKNGEYTCNACFSDGTGFTYHCSVCTFDLHIQCVNLPETVKRDDHEHVLKLFYSCPVEGEYPVCDVCHGNIQKDRWVYYCESCDYGTHLGCVDCEECEGDGNLENSILDAQAQLQRLQMQMEMSRQQAQFMASMGASLANLA